MLLNSTTLAVYCTVGSGRFFLCAITLIGDELHQRSIWITKINVDPLSLHSGPHSRTYFDRHIMSLKMHCGIFKMM
jgi:hypothetical protein